MDSDDLSAHIADPARLAALRAVALLDTPTEESFDRLTSLAAFCVSAPVALVSLVDSNRQFFKSCLGLPEPWSSKRETPLSHSFCQYNRIAKRPLLVEDARTHPLFKENPAIQELNVIAYLGIPLVTSDGYVLGSFCVIDSKPRKWSDDEIAIVEKLAASVMTEIQLRTEINARNQAEERLKTQHEELQEAYQDLEKSTAERVWALEQLRQRDQLIIKQSRLAAMGEMIGNIAHQWRQPLNTLGLMIQSLQLEYETGNLSDDGLKSCVENAMKTISQMSHTIDVFRNFFRADRDRVVFDIKESVVASLAMVEAELNEQQVKVDLQWEEGIKAEGLPNEFAQNILNILINSCDAFRERRIEKPIIMIRIFSAQGKSVVTIADNAGGIPAESMEWIFDPYFSTKGPEHGTGIGLFMSKIIIEKNMGGSLSVSNVGGGAEFRIEI